MKNFRTKFTFVALFTLLLSLGSLFSFDSNRPADRERGISYTYEADKSGDDIALFTSNEGVATTDYTTNQPAECCFVAFKKEVQRPQNTWAKQIGFQEGDFYKDIKKIFNSCCHQVEIREELAHSVVEYKFNNTKSSLEERIETLRKENENIDKAIELKAMLANISFNLNEIEKEEFESEDESLKKEYEKKLGEKDKIDADKKEKFKEYLQALTEMGKAFNDSELELEEDEKKNLDFGKISQNSKESLEKSLTQAKIFSKFKFAKNKKYFKTKAFFLEAAILQKEHEELEQKLKEKELEIKDFLFQVKFKEIYSFLKENELFDWACNIKASKNDSEQDISQEFNSWKENLEDDTFVSTLKKVKGKNFTQEKINNRNLIDDLRQAIEDARDEKNSDLNVDFDNNIGRLIQNATPGAVDNYFNNHNTYNGFKDYYYDGSEEFSYRPSNSNEDFEHSFSQKMFFENIEGARKLLDYAILKNCSATCTRGGADYRFHLHQRANRYKKSIEKYTSKFVLYENDSYDCSLDDFQQLMQYINDGDDKSIIEFIKDGVASFYIEIAFPGLMYYPGVGFRPGFYELGLHHRQHGSSRHFRLTHKLFKKDLRALALFDHRFLFKYRHLLPHRITNSSMQMPSHISIDLDRSGYFNFGRLTSIADFDLAGYELAFR